MNLTIELYGGDEPGTPVACSVADALLPADASLEIRLSRALYLAQARLPRALEPGDIVVVDGTRYFVTARGLQAVPAGYRPTLADLLVGFPDVERGGAR